MALLGPVGRGGSRGAAALRDRDRGPRIATQAPEPLRCGLGAWAGRCGSGVRSGDSVASRSRQRRQPLLVILEDPADVLVVGIESQRSTEWLDGLGQRPPDRLDVVTPPCV